MNQVTKISQQDVLDKLPFSNDKDIRDLNAAKTASEYVTAFTSAWKKNRLMYLYIGKKMFDLSQDDPNMWIEVRKKLRTTIHNGTISYMLDVGKSYERLSPHIEYLPDSLEGLKLLADASKEKLEPALQKLNKNKQTNNLPIKTNDVVNALSGKKPGRKVQSTGTKLPTVIKIQMTVDNYNQYGQKILNAIEKAQSSAGLTNRSMKVISKTISEEE